MLASNRTVYGRELKVTPLLLWVLQRASGILLGPLVALHVWAPTLASNGPLNALLLAIVVVHGYSGLRRIAVKRDKVALTKAMTWLWCLIVVVFGAIVVVARAA